MCDKIINYIGIILPNQLLNYNNHRPYSRVFHLRVDRHMGPIGTNLLYLVNG